MIDITIDGIRTTAADGETVLSVAKKAGIDIPTLCYHRALRPHRACRVCTVEVIRGEKTNYLTACTYRVTEPLTVNTRSAGALAKRGEAVRALLASSPGAGPLVAIAREASIEAAPEDSGEHCIRCGLCVRVCADVVGQKALSYEKGATGSPYAAVSADCIGCGACAANCPTGAITRTDAGGIRRFSPGGREFALAACRVCGGPITTEPHLAAIMDRRKLPDAVAGVCAACKRAAFAKRVGAGEPIAPPQP
jgi:predicted molibdopterin-dependent oxidoreductase YjgC